MVETHSFVTFQVEGVHSWPDAPSTLLHLRHPHRHQFHFKITFPQPEDRGIEFHEFKQYAQEIIMVSYGRTGPHASFVDFQDYSCEAIAGLMARSLVCSNRFRVRSVVVTVSEDGEFGSVVNASVLDFV